MKARMIYLLFLAFIMLTNNSCSDDEDSYKDGYINVSSPTVKLDPGASTVGIDVQTNLPDLKATVKSEEANWCTAYFQDQQLMIKAGENNKNCVRKATIIIESRGITKEITAIQTSKSYTGEDIKKDIKIPVMSAYATNFQPNEGIELSYDGNLNTIYHSDWDLNIEEVPTELTYNFATTVKSIDYLVYYPRQSGSNGRFAKIEIWTKTQGGDFVKYNDFDLNGRGDPSIIAINPGLKNPASIKIVVKTGLGQFASCAEMEFYQRNTEGFEYQAIFTDPTCSALKPGVTQADIDKIGSDLYKSLAQMIYSGMYDSPFRVQEYKPWQYPEIMAKINKTGTYSMRDNPTGIYLEKGEELICFVGDTHGQIINLIVQDLENKDAFNVAEKIPVSTGPNKYVSKSGGLIYVSYLTQTATEQPVKINIFTGKVNGYFDSQKHNSADWANLLKQATYKDFDVLGKYAHLTFPTSTFRKNTANDGLSLINKYDELVYLEQEFMGLVKYKKMFKNRMYFMVDYQSTGWMYATSYRTAFVPATLDDLTTFSIFPTDVWGPAHEVGHINQTRPSFKWTGMTEVTNNIHSLYVQTTFGNQSRLIKDGVYAKAEQEIIKGKIAHSLSKDPFNKLVPFWQLKLYMHDVLGKKDFYKDLYEYFRTHPDPSTKEDTDGILQLRFVAVVCEIAQLDLTDFFEAWGFLKPVDEKIDDYGNSRFTITEAQVNKLKEEIAAKKYPKPKHDNIYQINDNNISSFK